MELCSGYKGRFDDFVGLFLTTFSESEGTEEGALVAELAGNLLIKTAPKDLYVFSAWVRNELVAGIAFSRIWFENDVRTVFILSPVAVRTDHQQRGVGQALIRYGLDALKLCGVDITLTYGDPIYYRRVGFVPISADEALPPTPLSLPHGWLGQSLTGDAFEPLMGASRSVTALDDPRFW